MKSTPYVIIIVLLFSWIASAIAVSLYAYRKDIAWFPVLVGALFLGFPLVLLLVAIAASVVKRIEGDIFMTGGMLAQQPNHSSPDRTLGELS